eukprot:3612573-Pleurochrysis_carterae.AAC.1
MYGRTSGHGGSWRMVAPMLCKAYKEIIDALSSDVMLAHPDLHDPLAEYVIMTDASDVAAGA